MPVVGRVPKPEGQKVHRVQPAYDWLEVPDKPYKGPRPEISPDLSDMTHAWWAAVSSMPHCVLWTDTDWAFAVATAVIADAALAGGVGAATELRNREKIMGTTLDFRRAIRVRYVDPKPRAVAKVASLDDYRDL